MIYDVCALGEILIDAIAEADSEVHITGNAGGAPANVLACATKLGRSCAFISKAGDDYIGRWLKKIIDENAINTDGLILSPSKNTAIAMVSLSAMVIDHFLSIAAVVRTQVLKEVSSAWIL